MRILISFLLVLAGAIPAAVAEPSEFVTYAPAEVASVAGGGAAAVVWAAGAIQADAYNVYAITSDGTAILLRQVPGAERSFTPDSALPTIRGFGVSGVVDGVESAMVSTTDCVVVEPLPPSGPHADWDLDCLNGPHVPIPPNPPA